MLSVYHISSRLEQAIKLRSSYNTFHLLLGHTSEFFFTTFLMLQAPRLVPYFFGSQDVYRSFITIYSLQILGWILQACAVRFFEWSSRRFGVAQTLRTSIIASFFCLCGLAFLPGFEHIGYGASIGFTLALWGIKFLSTGESLWAESVLIDPHAAQALRLSSAYHGATLIGIIMAHLWAVFITYQHWSFMQSLFPCFLFTSLVLVRRLSSHQPQSSPQKSSACTKEKIEIKQWLAVALSSGLASAMYALPMILLDARCWPLLLLTPSFLLEKTLWLFGDLAIMLWAARLSWTQNHAEHLRQGLPWLWLMVLLCGYHLQALNAFPRLFKALLIVIGGLYSLVLSVWQNRCLADQERRAFARLFGKSVLAKSSAWLFQFF